MESGMSGMWRWALRPKLCGEKIEEKIGKNRQKDCKKENEKISKKLTGNLLKNLQEIYLKKLVRNMLNKFDAKPIC